MKKKGFLEISFGWLFAIIAGVFIIFLAIYFTTKISDTSKYEIDTKTAKSLDVLLNPLEISFESVKSTPINTLAETRIYNLCENSVGFFGRQGIQISQKTFVEWSEPGGEVSSKNKYIFSEEFIEGEKFYVFSKPFEFPFKVADLICMTSSKDVYCFGNNAPDDILEDLKGISQENLLFENCSGSDKYIQVCFSGGTNCDIEVNRGARYVKKNGENLYFYEDALMYAAIFSDAEVYECQLIRLMKRTSALSLLYKDKAIIASRTGCNYNVNDNLLSLSNGANDVEDSSNLRPIISDVETIKNKNNANQKCKLW